MALARHYKVSEIKQKLLHPAQTSVYSVDILTNPAVNNFLGATTVRTNQEAFNLSCCEASLPGSSLATHESNNDYHGSTEKMVYRRIYDDTIDLTFYVDYTYLTLKYFLGWMSFIVGEGSYIAQDEFQKKETFHRMTYPNLYKTNINILKFEKDVNPKSKKYTLGYEFVGAFPINLSSIPVSYEQSDLLKVTVSFAYQRYVIKSRFSPYSSSGVLGSPGASAGPATTPTAQADANSNYFASVATPFENAQYQSGGVDDLNFGSNVLSTPISSNTPGLSPQDLTYVQAERNLINSPLASQEARRLLAGESVGGTTFTLF